MLPEREWRIAIPTQWSSTSPKTTTPEKSLSSGVGFNQTDAARRVTASRQASHLAAVEQQAAPTSQQGLPGKQQAAPSIQHDLVPVQQLLSAQLPSLQQSTHPVAQQATPGGLHSQQLAFEDACELTPKPMSPRTAADAKVKTDRRFIVNSRIRVGNDSVNKWWQGTIHPAQIQ